MPLLTVHNMFIHLWSERRIKFHSTCQVDQDPGGLAVYVLDHEHVALSYYFLGIRSLTLVFITLYASGLKRAEDG